MEHNTHPVASLQSNLSNNNVTNAIPRLNIEDVTTTVLQTLNKHYTDVLNKVPDYCMETDINLQNIILCTPIKYLCIRNRLRSRDMTTLVNRQVNTVQQAILRHDNSVAITLNLLNPNLQLHVRTLIDNDIHLQPIRQVDTIYVYDWNKSAMVRALQLHSKGIRHNLISTKLLNNTKQLNVSVADSHNIYSKVNAIKSIQTKNKILRLIHGDVYCGARLKKFSLSDDDTCHRCFAVETIQHLLLDCPYTKEVWTKLGMQPTSLGDILISADKINTEILSHLLTEIVFRRKVLPPDVLIKTIYTSYSKGLCRNTKITERATFVLNTYHMTNIWNIQ